MFAKLKQQKIFSTSLLVFTLSVGVLIGTLVSTSVAAKESQAAPDATPLVIPPATKVANEFTELAKRVEPSVVYIRTDYTPKAITSSRRLPRNAPLPDAEEGDEDQMDMLRRFFGQGGGQGMPMQPPSKRQGSGSGFVVDRAGYIITNDHVVNKADHIFVKFPNQDTEYKAKVVGTDKETDIAVLKISAGKPLEPIRIANSDGVQVGDWAVAIGAPFGLETSVTVGIVSAKGRDINGAQMFQRFIQTDAAINPGNSGGPLLNRNGEVIGINTMIATETGTYNGIGFALPVNMAAKVYNSIIEHGRVVRGSVGVSFAKQTKTETFKALGLSGGVIVDSVQPGGPAEKAGIRKEDILLSMNGKPFKDGDDLMSRVSEAPVGGTVKIEGERMDAKGDSKKMAFNVTIEDRLKVYAKDARVTGGRELPEEPTTVSSTSTAKFGVGIVAIPEADRAEMQLDDKRGVRVSKVEPESFAEQIGVLPNDVIVSINRTPVYSIDDVRKVQGSLKTGDPVAFRIMRSLGRGGAWQGLYLSGSLPATE
ncbi:MAG: trypsin-like peptidase domain-containing protein [Bryobacteraceae bacterium]|nr:trypsin-like peptidase domain-containing protein [Bryobacteraceae bacterium]